MIIHWANLVDSNCLDHQITNDLYLFGQQFHTSFLSSQTSQYDCVFPLCLGAGNQLNITILDVLHMLLVEDKVVIVKMHPQASYLGQFVEEVLSPFFSKGFVELVYGGAQEGKHVCEHPSIRSIHLTGSSNTFNSIVWGPNGPEARKHWLKLIHFEI